MIPYGFDKFYDEWKKGEQDLKLDAYKEYSKGFNHDFLSATADLKETNSKNWEGFKRVT